MPGHCASAGLHASAATHSISQTRVVFPFRVAAGVDRTAFVAPPQQGSGSLLSPPEWPAFAPQSKGFGYPAVYSAEADRLLDEYRYALLDAFESVFGGE